MFLADTVRAQEQERVYCFPASSCRGSPTISSTIGHCCNHDTAPVGFSYVQSGGQECSECDVGKEHVGW